MASTHKQKSPVAVLLALLVGVCFGLGAAISDVINNLGFSVAQYSLIQFASAMVIFGIMFFARFRAPISRRDIVFLLLIGVGNAVSSIMYFLAVKLISVGQAVAFQFQYVWIIIVIEALWDRTKPTKTVVIASILVIIGTFFSSGLYEELVSGDAVFSGAGLAAALVCAVAYGAAIFANGRVAVDEPTVPRAFYQSIGGFLTTLIALPLMGLEPFDFVALLPWGVLLGLIMDVIPILCIVYSTTRLSEGIVGVLTSVELPVAVVAGILLLGEPAKGIRFLGIVIILAGIVLTQAEDLFGKGLRKQAETE